MALGWAAVLVAGFGAGLASVKPTLRLMVDRTSIHNGPWRTSLTTGSAAGNPYERAAVAVAGLYALAKEETIYYTAFTDDAGEPLDAHCAYELRGAALPARWWSVTMYGADDFLVPNPAGLYSRHARNLEPDGDGAYAVEISPWPQPRNWLPAPATGRFSVTLRLYNPAAAVYANPGTIRLPDIARTACR